MDINLFSLFDEELFNEAKRLVPIVYNEDLFFSYDEKNLKKIWRKNIKLFILVLNYFLLAYVIWKKKMKTGKMINLI